MTHDEPMVTVSREMAVELGLVTPTPEELAAPADDWRPAGFVVRAVYAVREWLGR